MSRYIIDLGYWLIQFCGPDVDNILKLDFNTERVLALAFPPLSFYFIFKIIFVTCIILNVTLSSPQSHYLKDGYGKSSSCFTETKMRSYMPIFCSCLFTCLLSVCLLSLTPKGKSGTLSCSWRHPQRYGQCGTYSKCSTNTFLKKWMTEIIYEKFLAWCLANGKGSIYISTKT